MSSTMHPTHTGYADADIDAALLLEAPHTTESLVDQVFRPDIADPSAVIAAETPGLKHVGMRLNYSDVISPASASNYMYFVKPGEERPSLFLPITAPTGEFAVAGPYYAFSRGMNAVDTYDVANFTGVRVKGCLLTVDSVAAFQAGGNISGLVSAGVVANPPGPAFFSHSRLAEQESNPAHELINLPLYSARTTVRLPSLGDIHDTIKQRDIGPSDVTYTWQPGNSAYTSFTAPTATIFSTVDANQNQPSSWIFPGSHANPVLDLNLTAYFSGASAGWAYLDVFYGNATVAGTGIGSYSIDVACQYTAVGADTTYQLSCNYPLRAGLPAGFETAPIMGFRIRLVAASGSLLTNLSRTGTVTLTVNRYRQMDLLMAYMFVREVPQTFTVAASSTVDLIMSASSEKSFGSVVTTTEVSGDMDMLTGLITRAIVLGGIDLVYRGEAADKRIIPLLRAATRVGMSWSVGDVFKSVKRLASKAWDQAAPAIWSGVKAASRPLMGSLFAAARAAAPPVLRPAVDAFRRGMSDDSADEPTRKMRRVGQACYGPNGALPEEWWGYVHQAAQGREVKMPQELEDLLRGGQVTFDLVLPSGERARKLELVTGSKPIVRKEPAPPAILRPGFAADADQQPPSSHVAIDVVNVGGGVGIDVVGLQQSSDELHSPAVKDDDEDEYQYKSDEDQSPIRHNPRAQVGIEPQRPFWYQRVTDPRTLQDLNLIATGKAQSQLIKPLNELQFVRFKGEPDRLDSLRILAGKAKAVSRVFVGPAHQRMTGAEKPSRYWYLAHPCRSTPPLGAPPAESSDSNEGLCSCSINFRSMLKLRDRRSGQSLEAPGYDSTRPKLVPRGDKPMAQVVPSSDQRRVGLSMESEARPERPRARDLINSQLGPAAPQDRPQIGEIKSYPFLDELLQLRAVPSSPDGTPPYLAPWRNVANVRSCVSAGLFHGAPLNMTATSASFFAGVFPAPDEKGEPAYGIWLLSLAEPGYYIDASQRLAQIPDTDIVRIPISGRPKAVGDTPLTVHLNISLFEESKPGHRQSLINYVAETFPFTSAGSRALNGRLGLNYELDQRGAPVPAVQFTRDVYITMIPVGLSSVSGLSCMNALALAMASSPGVTLSSGAIVKTKNGDWVSAPVLKFKEKAVIASALKLALTVNADELEPTDLDDFDKVARSEGPHQHVFVVRSVAESLLYENYLASQVIELGVKGEAVQHYDPAQASTEQWLEARRLAEEKGLLQPIDSTDQPQVVKEEKKMNVIRGLVVSKMAEASKKQKKEAKAAAGPGELVSDGHMREFNAQLDVVRDKLREALAAKPSLKMNIDAMFARAEKIRKEAADKLNLPKVNGFFDPIATLQLRVDNLLSQGQQALKSRAPQADALSAILNRRAPPPARVRAGRPAPALQQPSRAPVSVLRAFPEAWRNDPNAMTDESAYVQDQDEARRKRTRDEAQPAQRAGASAGDRASIYRQWMAGGGAEALGPFADFEAAMSGQ